MARPTCSSRTLDMRPMHGSAILEGIAQITRGTFQVKAGSLFPAFHRLEPKGWIDVQAMTALLESA